MKAKPTEGPWMCVTAGSVMAGYSQGYAIVQNGKPNLIAGVFSDVAGGDDVAKANGEHIAMCVNAHDELVAELRNVSRASADAFGVGEDEFRREFVEWAQNRCRHLLAKMEATSCRQ